MENVYKRVELLANVAIIIVALLICGVLVKRYVIGSPADENRSIKQVKAGTSISLPDVDWTASRQTLLLVLSRGCHFCSDSAPFYQRLAQKTSADNDVRLIAVFPHGVDEGRQYLNELRVSIPDVRQASLALLGVTGTPMLILVNDSGVVESTWVGQLPPDQETEILSRL